MQEIFRQTTKEALREIEETIAIALKDYDLADRNDDEEAKQRACAIINAELEKLEELKVISKEIKLVTEEIQ